MGKGRLMGAGKGSVGSVVRGAAEVRFKGCACLFRQVLATSIRTALQ